MDESDAQIYLTNERRRALAEWKQKLISLGEANNDISTAELIRIISKHCSSASSLYHELGSPILHVTFDPHFAHFDNPISVVVEYSVPKKDLVRRQGEIYVGSGGEGEAELDVFLALPFENIKQVKIGAGEIVESYTADQLKVMYDEVVSEEKAVEEAATAILPDNRNIFRF